MADGITHPIETFKSKLSKEDETQAARSTYQDTEILEDGTTKVSGYTKDTYQGMMAFIKDNDYDERDKAIENYMKSPKSDKNLKEMNDNIAKAFMAEFNQTSSYDSSEDKLKELDAKYPGALSYILNSGYISENYSIVKENSVRNKLWDYAYEHNYVTSEEPEKGSNKTMTYTVASAAAMMNITAQQYANKFEYSDSLEVLNNDANSEVAQEYVGKVNEMLETFEAQGLDLSEIQSESRKLAIYTANQSASEIDEISPGEDDMDLKIAEVTKGMLTTTTAGSLVDNKYVSADEAINAMTSDNIFGKIKAGFLKKSETLYNFLDSKDKSFVLTDKIHDAVQDSKNAIAAKDTISEITDATSNDSYQKRIAALSELNVSSDEEASDDTQYDA
jgi:hypothetical protein